MVKTRASLSHQGGRRKSTSESCSLATHTHTHTRMSVCAYYHTLMHTYMCTHTQTGTHVLHPVIFLHKGEEWSESNGVTAWLCLFGCLMFSFKTKEKSLRQDKWLSSWTHWELFQRTWFPSSAHMATKKLSVTPQLHFWGIRYPLLVSVDIICICYTHLSTQKADADRSLWVSG